VASGGARVVGAAVSKGVGTLLFLPPLDLEDEELIRYEEESDQRFWTDEAIKLGKRLLGSLVALHQSFKSESSVTPPPEWSNATTYRLQMETEIEAEIGQRTDKISEVQAEKNQLEEELAAAVKLRRLLFEQGKPLEKVVLEALELMGFSAEGFDDGESEFDAA